MSLLRRIDDDERGEVLAIVNAAAEAYRGVIPADRWHDPYMSGGALGANNSANGVVEGLEGTDVNPLVTLPARFCSDPRVSGIGGRSFQGRSAVCHSARFASV